MTLRTITQAAKAVFAFLVALVLVYPTVLVIVLTAVAGAAGLLTGTVVYFTDRDAERDPDGQEHPASTPGRETGRPPAAVPAPAGGFLSAPPADMGPGAGYPTAAVTTATCPSVPQALKVDSPAPDDVPGRDGDRAGGAATPGPESEGASRLTAPVPANPGRRGRHAAPKPGVWDRLPRPVIARPLRPVPPVPAVTADTLPAVLRRPEVTS